MINAVLHLLTNRTDTFGDVMYPNISDYVVHTETEGETYLRDFLKLRSTDSLYYLTGVLAAVYSFPEIVEEFGETDRTYSFSDYKQENFSVTNGTLEEQYGKSVKVEYFPSSYPVIDTTTLQYLNSTKILARRGEDSRELPFTVRLGGYLDVEWPEDWGITGVLGTNGNDWEEYYKITINHPPNSYPYAFCAQKMLKNDKIHQFLDNFGLYEELYASQSPIEQVAIAGLALGLSGK